MPKENNGSGSVISVDFTNVSTEGGSVHIPEGDYAFKITSAKLKKGGDSGKLYIEFFMTVTQGSSKGLKKKLRHTCSLQPQSLWSLRNLMESAGKQVPSKAVKLDVNKMVGYELAGSVVDDEYDGKKKSIIASFFPIADLSAPGKETEETEDEETEAGNSAAADIKEEESEEESEELFG